MVNGDRHQVLLLAMEPAGAFGDMARVDAAKELRVLISGQARIVGRPLEASARSGVQTSRIAGSNATLCCRCIRPEAAWHHWRGGCTARGCASIGLPQRLSARRPNNGTARGCASVGRLLRCSDRRVS